MRAQRPPGDDAAVQSIMGEIVMLGAIVVLVVGLSLFFFQTDPPPEARFSELSVFAACGEDGTWGTGDELLTLVHVGGEAIDGQTTVRYTIDGATTTREGAELGAVFDGGFRIGERWQETVSMDLDAAATMEVVVENPGGTSQLLFDRVVEEWRCAGP